MAELSIIDMGARGEGVARGRDGEPLYVPYTLPGEQVEATVEGARARLIKLVTPSPERIEPVCKYFGTCGGCQVQHWQHAPYATWKQAMVGNELARRGLGKVEVAGLVDAHGAGRRRFAHRTYHPRQCPPHGAAAAPHGRT